MRSRTRVAGLVVAVITTAGLALSATSAGANGSLAPGQAKAAAAGQVETKKPAPGQTVDPVLRAAAKRFGVSEKRVGQALAAVKRYLSKQESKQVDLLQPAVVAVFAKSLGVPIRKARAVLTYLLAEWAKGGKGKPAQPGDILSPAAVKFFAAELHVSLPAAEKALRTLAKLGKVTDKDLAAIARSLGVSLKQLQAATVALKQFLTKEQPGKPGKPGEPGEPGKPGKPGKPATGAAALR